ncbi:hypothetical protein [uncultured Intestinimonas sp.]|uniref:hypothetical protein n=1 Tax=uncultured Intestinimonas sp. TaxID=1689265 RepID=UPI0025FE2121|nr:hypothetical protein [uncultured Intestinimonas sp.]
MRLEDATKEELIWWIQGHAFDLSYSLKRFEADIMLHRYDEYNAKARLAGERFSSALSEYNSLLAPYNEERLSSIPEHVIKRAAALEKVMSSASKEQRRWWKAAD